MAKSTFVVFKPQIFHGAAEKEEFLTPFFNYVHSVKDGRDLKFT